jgi:hypothetical protein
MEIIYLPFISPHNYEAFRRILHSDLPNTYDEWFQLHANERADRGRVGLSIREIKVNPNEFSRFLNARGMAASPKALGAFTIEKASGKSY